jgi:integrase/recombinase XerD
MLAALRHCSGVHRRCDDRPSLRPNGLRYFYATESLRLGVALQEVQDAVSHADPRTTRRYESTRQNLDRSSTYLLATALNSE